LLPAEADWEQRIPDSMLDPAAIVAGRESLRLALIATLQERPGRQRAVFILRDVLAWPASAVSAGDGNEHGGGQKHVAARGRACNRGRLTSSKRSSRAS
jgi:hypothetical protein